MYHENSVSRESKSEAEIYLACQYVVSSSRAIPSLQNRKGVSLASWLTHLYFFHIVNQDIQGLWDMLKIKMYHKKLKWSQGYQLG